MLSLEMRDDRSEKVRYDYTDYPIYIRRALLSSYPGYAAPTHWHDDIEFIAVLSGEMQYNVNGEIVTLAENEGIFVNARQMHFGFSPNFLILSRATKYISLPSSSGQHEISLPYFFISSRSISFLNSSWLLPSGSTIGSSLYHIAILKPPCGYSTTSRGKRKVIHTFIHFHLSYALPVLQFFSL